MEETCLNEPKEQGKAEVHQELFWLLGVNISLYKTVNHLVTRKSRSTPRIILVTWIQY